jgi:hypothetical protein
MLSVSPFQFLNSWTDNDEVCYDLYVIEGHTNSEFLVSCNQ